MTGLFDKRFRGFRVINLVGWGLLATLILGVYLAKTFAWSERNQIAAVESQIRQERLRIRLLKAEVAHLEQPRRLEALSSTALGLAPIVAKQEIELKDLQKFARPPPADPAQPALTTVRAEAALPAPSVVAIVAAPVVAVAQTVAPLAPVVHQQ